MTSNEVDASSLLALSDDGVAVCYLCLDGGLDDAISRCDVIVRAEAQMRDLSTSHALLIMQQPKVNKRVIRMNSGIRG